MADSLFDLELPDDGDRVSLIGAPASSRASTPRAHSARSASRAPLAVRMRPRTIDEVLGQEHLLTPGAPLRVLAGENAGPAGPSSVILYGPPGTGKTTLAHVIARAPGRKFVELSAITAGVKDVRAVMDQALLDRDMYGTTTVLFLDEIHRFTRLSRMRSCRRGEPLGDSGGGYDGEPVVQHYLAAALALATVAGSFAGAVRY